MTLENLVQLLNEDLKREYAHWHFYINAAIRVTGVHREEIQEFFQKEAAGEMQHIQEFGQLILGLGGVPTTDVAYFITPGLHNSLTRDITSDTQPEFLLNAALKMEMEVVECFVQRMEQAAELEESGIPGAKVNGRYVQIFLEEQMLDSRHTVDHIKEMLK